MDDGSSRPIMLKLPSLSHLDKRRRKIMHPKPKHVCNSTQTNHENNQKNELVKIKTLNVMNVSHSADDVAFDFCVGTHDGRFHADDVLGTALLFFLHDDLPSKIIRSRKPEELKKCSHVVDVGGNYDLSKNLFDHHQISCNETFDSPTGIPLSASGLIYRDLGRQIINKILEENPDLLKSTVDVDRGTLVEKVHNRAYFMFFQEIDAIDNGVKRLHQQDWDRMKRAEKYSTRTSFSSIIGSFNHSDFNSEQQLQQFGVAVQTAWNITFRQLLNAIRHCIDQMIETTGLDLLMRDREANGALKHCLVLPSDFKTVNGYLKKHDTSQQIKFTISPRKPGEWGVYAVQSAPYTNLIDLITQEQALQYIEDSNEFSQDDFIFIHKKLFVGSAKSVELAIQLAEWSIDQYFNNYEQVEMVEGIRELSNSLTTTIKLQATQTPPSLQRRMRMEYYKLQLLSTCVKTARDQLVAIQKPTYFAGLRKQKSAQNHMSQSAPDSDATPNPMPAADATPNPTPAADATPNAMPAADSDATPNPLPADGPQPHDDPKGNNNLKYYAAGGVALLVAAAAAAIVRWRR